LEVKNEIRYAEGRLHEEGKKRVGGLGFWREGWKAAAVLSEPHSKALE
jgi:hypothetical protein